MNPSDLYHQHGVKEQVCTRAEYGSKTIVLHIKTKRVEFYCPKCKSTEVIRSGVVTRRFRTVPVGGKPVVLTDAVYVFDHFHVVKLVNEALDKVRKRIVNQERSREKREAEERAKTGAAAVDNVSRSSVVKGTKYILLRNREDLSEQKDVDRLNAALQLNRDLSVAYYLKEDARLVWTCESKRSAALQLDSWIAAARAADIPELTKLANTIESHRDGILAYFDKPISTGPVEGINNKIKTLKRMAYGFRDDQYFNLRLLALHGFKYS